MIFMNPDTLACIELALDHIDQAILITNPHGIITSTNKAAVTLLDRAPKDILAHTVDTVGIMDPTNEFKAVAANLRQGFACSWSGSVAIDGPTRKALAATAVIPVPNSALPHQSQRGVYHVLLLKNISREKAQNDQIRFLATHDRTTGLPNAGLFKKFLATSIAISKRSKSSAAVLSVMIRNLEMIAEVSGHDAHNRIVSAIAGRLQENLREGDTVAIIKPDQFMVAALNLAVVDDSMLIARKLAAALSQPIDLPGFPPIIVTVHVGIALFPQDGEDVDQLMANATLATTNARRTDNLARIFSKDMHAHATARVRLEDQLRLALRSENQLVPYFQKIVDAKTHQPVGCEALIRWKHPKNGLISPSQFIPLAEETGLIVSIGQTMLAKSCLAATKWPHSMSIAVNVSPKQFRHQNFIKLVENTLAWSRLPSHRLTVEITESAVMHNVADAIAIMNTLRDMKVGISMDDFGTGHSSLANLERFHLTKLKIDKAFVDRIHKSSKARAIVSATIMLAESLGITTTIAEGVEIEEQLKILTDLGCRHIQGYLFSKPIAEEDLDMAQYI